MAEPANNESVSQGCMRRMCRGKNRESMYGEYNKENLKPVPVVQILRWQGTRKEWVVIDLVPETSEPCQPDEMSPSKKMKNGWKKSEGNSSEHCQADKMSPSKKPYQEKMKNSCKISNEPRKSENKFFAKKIEEKEVVKNNCKKTDAIKTPFCFQWKEKALAVPKCIKKANDNKNPITEAKNRINSKQSNVGDISRDDRNLSNDEPTSPFENIPILSPEIIRNQSQSAIKSSIGVHFIISPSTYITTLWCI